jgi:DNA-binding transcriptional ArsR family regulator
MPSSDVRAAARVASAIGTARRPHHPPTAELDLATVLQALSDPIRLQIVRSLDGGTERPCGDFHGLGGVTVPTLSHHLRVLREAGLTHTRLVGKHRLISLRNDDLEARFPGVVTAILRSAGVPRNRAARADGRYSG